MIKSHVLLILISASCAWGNEPLAAAMSEAASTLLSRVSSSLVNASTFSFTDEERTDWHYFPSGSHSRRGLTYNDLDAVEQEALGKLLSLALSPEGVKKVRELRTLETVLKELTGQAHRDENAYTFNLFGTPSKKGTWGWRLEGHHLSLNYTIEEGTLVSFTPQFWGANPDTVPSGPAEGKRLLDARDDRARRFFKILTTQQRAAALFSPNPPHDILTKADQNAGRLKPLGLDSRSLTAPQKEALLELIDAYLGLQTESLAKAVRAKVNALETLYFACAGDLLGGGPRYYRITFGDYLIEYCNTQGRGNHSHSVLRAIEADFGTKD